MGQSSLLRLQEGRRPTVRRPFAAAAVRYRTYATAAFDRTARDLHDGASPQLERLPDDQPHQTRSRELAASRLQAVVRILRGVMMDEYYEAQPEGWQAAVPRLQAAARSKLVRNNYYPFVPDDRSPPSTRTSSLRRSHIPSPTSSAASAAPTASPGSPASPTLLPSPCAIFPSPPSPPPLRRRQCRYHTLYSRAGRSPPPPPSRLTGGGGHFDDKNTGFPRPDPRQQSTCSTTWSTGLGS